MNETKILSFFNSFRKRTPKSLKKKIKKSNRKDVVSYFIVYISHKNRLMQI